MFRHNLIHTGTTTSNGPVENVTLLWMFQAGAPVWSSPAAVDGRVFVGCRDGNVYCLNASDGSRIWSYQLGAVIYYSSPTIVDDKVYVGSDDGCINCLDINNGEPLWRTMFGGPVRSSPAIVDGRLYVGCDDKNLYCLNVTNGEKLWDYPAKREIESSPTVFDGMVYFGSVDNYLYALNATTGEWVWWFFTRGSVDCSPCIYNGCVYIGSGLGHVYCVNASSGEQVWEFQTGNAVASSPAIANGRLYIGSEDNNLYCLNASTGQKIWQEPTGYWIWSSPAVAGNYVYVGSEDYSIYCFDALTGEQKWSYPTGNAVCSSPAIAYDNLYVGSCDHHIYALTSSTTAPTELPPSSKTNVLLFDTVSLVIAGAAVFAVAVTVRNSIQARSPAEPNSKRGIRAWISAHPDATCLIAILGFSVLFFVNLNSGALWGADEQTYSQWAYHMLRSGDYLTPWNACDASLWVSKPPLAIWFMSLGYQMFGVTNFGLRFWSAVFGTLCCVLLFYLGKKLYNREVGVVSAFVMGTFTMFFVFAQRAMTDVFLVFFMLCSIYCMIRVQEGKHANWFAALSGFAFGLAFLTKQVQALLIPLILFLYLVATKKSLRFVLSKRAILFISVAAAVFVPWVVLMDMRWHTAFWDEYFFYSAYSRSVVAIEGHTGGYLYYFQYLFEHDNLLWVMLLPFAAAFCVFNAFVKRHKADVLLIAWIVVAVGVFTFAQTKLYWYLLPAIPAFALAISNLLYKLYGGIRVHVLAAFTFILHKSNLSFRV